MLISRFNLKDIKDYEALNRCSLLEMLNEVSTVTIIEFIKLGNESCDDERAGDILDEFLSENDLLDAYTEIRDCLIGKRYVHEESSEQAETKNYRNLTELYQSMGVDLRAYASLGYSEFWSMSVDDLFLEFNIVNDKVIKEKQDELNSNHTLAHMISQAICGKLGAEPPQLIKQENNQADEDGEFSNMDQDTIRSLLNLKALQKIHNQEVKDNGES